MHITEATLLDFQANTDYESIPQELSHFDTTFEYKYYVPV